MIITGNLCFEGEQFFLKDMDGIKIDFPQLFYQIIQKRLKLVDEPFDCVSLAQIGMAQQNDESFDAFFSFVIFLWRRLSDDQSVEDDLVSAYSLKVGIICMDTIQKGDDEDEIWNSYQFFDHNDVLSGRNTFSRDLFASANDFLTEMLDEVAFTNIEFRIVSKTTKKQDWSANGLSIVEILPIVGKIHFDLKYTSPPFIDDLEPCVVLE